MFIAMIEMKPEHSDLVDGDDALDQAEKLEDI